MIKLNTTGKKPKSTQYVVGGVVAVIILLCWISIPLMNSSSLDSSAGSGSLFKTSTADVGSLGSDIPSEGGAPGYSLDGQMLYNPATSGENIASSLFQSGPEDEETPSVPSAPDIAGPVAPGSGPGASAGVTASPGSKGKLNAMPSITGGNGNSVTTGGKFDKPFGTGASKQETGPTLDQLAKKNLPAAEKRSALIAMLQKAEDKSVDAAKSNNANDARGSATGAFEKTKTDANLNSGLEQAAGGAGLETDAAAQDLKRSDPSLSKNKSTIPEPKVGKDESKEADEEMKKMIVQMLISSVLGPMFSSVFGAATAAPAATGAK